MKLHQHLLWLSALVYATAAPAQWQWVDQGGRKVFSDRPPPLSVPDKNILQRPHGNTLVPPTTAPAQSEAPGTPAADTNDAPADDAAAPQADNAAEGAPQPQAPATAGASQDKPLADKLAQQQAAEAAQQKAREQEQAQRQAKLKADNCARARQTQATLTSGRLLAHTNSRGEQGFMDDATRNAELKRVQQVIDSDCK